MLSFICYEHKSNSLEEKNEELNDLLALSIFLSNVTLLIGTVLYNIS